jgi:membrane-bound lytic murein transglycosylase C
LIAGCSKNQIANNATAIITSSDPIATASRIATTTATDYAVRGVSYIIAEFTKEIDKRWGKNAPKATAKEYVKYTQNYESMSRVNFENGLVTVQTIDTKNPKYSLQKAIKATLLTPYDPRGVDLYSAKEIKYQGVPYLYKQLKDHQGKYIQYEWRAEQFAKYLVKNRLKSKSINVNGKRKKAYYVSVPMIKNHSNVRAHKYDSIITKYSRKYNISKPLVYAIMKTESNFNPYAVSHIPAYGLMQIVPKSAGRDAYRYVYNKDKTPSREFLFNADNNIRFGVAYLNILNTRYLKDIKNPLSREYCVISAYNTGSGNVLKTFSSSRSYAIKRINAMSSSSIYNKLRASLPYSETRRYLYKVVVAKKEYSRI